jgi:hypothetical protein
MGSNLVLEAQHGRADLCANVAAAHEHDVASFGQAREPVIEHIGVTVVAQVQNLALLLAKINFDGPAASCENELVVFDKGAAVRSQPLFVKLDLLYSCATNKLDAVLDIPLRGSGGRRLVSGHARQEHGTGAPAADIDTDHMASCLSPPLPTQVWNPGSLGEGMGEGREKGESSRVV